MNIQGNTALYNKELIIEGFSASPMLVCIFRIMLWKLKISMIKIQTSMLFISFVKNAVLIPIYHVKAVQGVISSKTVRLWLRNAAVRPKLFLINSDLIPVDQKIWTDWKEGQTVPIKVHKTCSIELRFLLLILYIWKVTDFEVNLSNGRYDEQITGEGVAE